MNSKLFPRLNALIEELRIQEIPASRKEILQPLVEFFQAKLDKNEQININFICTHNSRRSHLSQVWCQSLAHYFNVPKVQANSGGTEATALYPVVVSTLKKQGFVIDQLNEGDNPIYAIKYSENEEAIQGFSKVYNDAFNPQSNFAAVLTCNEADGACPIISGADKRIPITYEDPKAFDTTPEQEKKYLERSLQIANEIYFVYSQLNKNGNS